MDKENWSMHVVSITIPRPVSNRDAIPQTAAVVIVISHFADRFNATYAYVNMKEIIVKRLQHAQSNKPVRMQHSFQ